MTEQAVETGNPWTRLRTGLAPRWRWLAWGLIMLAWTASLLSMGPVKARDAVVEDHDVRWLMGKSLHVGAYAFLVVLTSWQRLPQRWRWVLLGGLLAHGALTELGQYLLNHFFQINRTGCWEDVGIDTLGIALGVAITWKRWFVRREGAGHDEHQHLPENHQ